MDITLIKIELMLLTNLTANVEDRFIFPHGRKLDIHMHNMIVPIKLINAICVTFLSDPRKKKYFLTYAEIS